MSEKNKKDNLDDFELDSNSPEEFEFEESKNEDLDFEFEIEEEKPVASKTKEVEVEDDFDFDIEEEKPATSKTKEVEVEDDFDFDIEEEKPATSKTKEVEVEDDFDFDIEEEKPVVSKTKEVEVEDDFDFDIEEEKPVVSKTKEIEVEDDFDFDIEEEKPVVSKIKEKEEDKKEFDFEEIEEDFFEEPKQIAPKVEVKKPNKIKENTEKPIDIGELFNDNKSEKQEGFDIDSFIKNDNSNEEFTQKNKTKTFVKVDNNDLEDYKSSKEENNQFESKVENTNKKQNSFSLTKIMVSLIGVSLISAVSYLGYVNKDNLSNIVSNKNIIESEDFINKTREIANEVAELKTNDYKLKLESAITQINKLNEEQSNLIQENLNLKEEIKNIKQLQENTNTSNIEMQIASFSEKINSMEVQQTENKELLKKAVHATLSLIKENQNLDKNLEDKVYQKVYNEFEKIFNSQRFRLNDLSIIESKMNENVQIINQIKQDLRQYKSENENLKTKIKLLENNDKATTSIVIDKKAKTEPKKSIVENKNIVPKENVKVLNQNNFKIQGIIDSNIAYIIVKGFNNSKAKAYTIGDTVPNCGKITKITENTVVCAGGTLKYNN